MIRQMAITGAAFLLLAAAPQTYGPSRSFDGVFTASFEHSEFGGCWLSFSPTASKRFFSIMPHDKYWGASYRIAFTGRVTPRLKTPTRGKGYGHVGAYPCEIQVSELKSARLIRPIRP